MSVVVIGLQHKQAPLSLLEAVAVGDADLHKVLAALSHRRNLQETVVLSTCLRTEVYSVVDRFHDAVAEVYEVLSEHSGVSDRRAGGARHRPLRRRRHLPSLLGHLRVSSRPSWARAKSSGRSGGPSSRPRRKASAARCSRPSSSTPCRRASGCAPRRASHAGPPRSPTPPSRWPAARAATGLRDKRVVVVGAGEMGLGVSRALCDIPAGVGAPQHRGGQPLPGPGRGPRARGGRRRRSSGPAVSRASTPNWPRPTSCSPPWPPSRTCSRRPTSPGWPAPCW